MAKEEGKKHSINWDGSMKTVNSSIRKETSVHTPFIGQSSGAILSSREAAIIGQVIECRPDVTEGVIPFGVIGGNERLDRDVEPSAGFIFMCSGRTKPECFRYCVFGLPIGKLDDVKKIQPGMKLFLFDFDVKLLYGIYEATSCGQLNLEPMAFSQRFPAQVKFRIFKECLPVPESAFRHVIIENYFSSFKFKQELQTKQVNSLMALFRDIDLTPMYAPNTLYPHTSVTPADSTCASGPHHTGAMHMPRHHQLEHANTQLPYGRYLPESRVVGVQSTANPRYNVQKVAHARPNQTLPGLHQPYGPEEPLLSVTDTYGRVAVTPEVAPIQLAAGYVNRNYGSDPPRGTQTVAHLNHGVKYYSQLAAPASASYGSASAATLPVQPPAYYAHGGSSSSYYQPYCIPTTHRVQTPAHTAVPLVTTMPGSANSSNEAEAVTLIFSQYGVAPTGQC